MPEVLLAAQEHVGGPVHETQIVAGSSSGSGPSQATMGGQASMAAAMALEDGCVHAVRADMEVQQGSSSLTVVRWISRLNDKDRLVPVSHNPSVLSASSLAVWARFARGVYDGIFRGCWKGKSHEVVSDVQKDKMVFSIQVILVVSAVQKDKMDFSIQVILVVSAVQKDKMVFSIQVILVVPAVQKGKMVVSIQVILVVSAAQKGKMDFSIKVILVVSDVQKGKMVFSIQVILVVSDVQKG
eukprot:s6554_g1.t1